MKTNLTAIFAIFLCGLTGIANAQQGYTPTLDAGNVTTSAPTYASGTVQPLSIDTSGNLRVVSSGGGGGGGAVNVIATSSATGAITPCVAGSAASSCILKASAGNLYSAYVTAGSTAGYLMVFNSATLPSNGSTTAGTSSGNMVECVNVAANSTTSINFNPGPPEVFSTGITAAFSSTGCTTLTASATAFIKGSAQ